MLSRRITRAMPLGVRFYANPPKNKVSKFIDDIGKEDTKTSQNTLKTVRWMGGATVIAVLCSLFWASSMSAPVKEKEVDVGDLSKDIRKVED